MDKRKKQTKKKEDRETHLGINKVITALFAEYIRND